MEVKYLGITFDIEGNYTPAEPMVMYYNDMSGYDGSPAEFEITSVEINGEDAEEIVNALDAWDDLANLVIEEWNS